MDQNLVDKLIQVNEQSGEEYRNSADLNIYFSSSSDSVDIEAPKKVDVSFSIETEYRSWGTKGETVTVIKPISISLDIVTLDDNGYESSRDEKTITIDIDKIEYEWVEGGGITIQELEVEISQDFEVVNSKATFSYWVP